MKPFREPSAVKPVIEVAKKEAEAYLNPFLLLDWRPEPVDVVTRLRAAACLGEDAGLDVEELRDLEQEVRRRFAF